MKGRLSPAAAARVLGCHVGTVYRLILAQRLPAVRCLGRYWIAPADIEALARPVEVKRRGETWRQRNARAVGELKARGLRVE